MIDIKKLVLTKEEIEALKDENGWLEDLRKERHLTEAYEIASRATIKKVVKYIDKERGAWYNGGVIIRKEVWETLAQSLEKG